MLAAITKCEPFDSGTPVTPVTPVTPAAPTAPCARSDGQSHAHPFPSPSNRMVYLMIDMMTAQMRPALALVTPCAITLWHSLFAAAGYKASKTFLYATRQRDHVYKSP